MNEALRDALEAVNSGQPQRARVILAEYLRDEPQNVPAWVLLSKLATTEGQKTAFLRKILDLDPDHAYARQALAETEVVQPPVAAVGEPAADVEATEEAPASDAQDPELAVPGVDEELEEEQFASRPVEPDVFQEQQPFDAEAAVEEGEEGEPEWLASTAFDDVESEEALAARLESGTLEEVELEEDFASWLDSEALEDEETEEELASWLDSKTLEEEELDEDFATWLDSEALDDEETEDELASWLDSEALDDEESEEELASWLESETLEEEELQEDFASWLDAEAIDEEESEEELAGWLESEPLESEESEEEEFPSWLDAEALGQEDVDETEETLFEAPTPAPFAAQEESVEQDLSGQMWEGDDEWLAQAEDDDAVDVTDAVASEKAARLSAAMSEASPQPAESDADTGSGRNWLLAVLIFVAAVVFLLLVYAVLTFML